MKKCFILFLILNVFGIFAEIPAEIQFRKGNYKNSLISAQDSLRILSSNDPSVAEVYLCAFKSAEKLRDFATVEKLFELAETKYQQNIPLLAKLYPPHEEWGYLLNGKFHRGYLRGNAGRRVYAGECDRARILTLLLKAAPLADRQPESSRAKFYLNLQRILLKNRNYNQQVWRLQEKTLPPKEKYGGYFSEASGLPVLPDGSPLYFDLPKTLDSAVNDGERLRFAVSKGGCHAQKEYADFLRRNYTENQVPNASGNERDELLFSLADDETFARFSNGTQRIRMPDHINFIKQYRALKEWNILADIYIERHQYAKALDCLEKQLKEHPGDLYALQMQKSIHQTRLQLPSLIRTPAGFPVKLPVSYRNNTELTIRIFPMDTQKILQEFLRCHGIRAHHKNLPYIFPDLAGVADKDPWKNFIGPEKKALSFKLKKALHPYFHMSDTIEVAFPEPGIYLLRSALKNGKEQNSVIWCSREILTARSRGNLVFLNDAVSGKPCADRRLILHEFENGKTIQHHVSEFKTDKNGVAELKFKRKYRGDNFLIAGDKDNIAVLTSLPNNLFVQKDPAQQIKTFMITDRPVYKPGDTVHLTGYLRQVSYGPEKKYKFPASVQLNIHSPLGKDLGSKTLPVDSENGYFVLDQKLKENAELGSYYVSCSRNGWISFRVEEYKKPEYSVTVSVPQKTIPSDKNFSAEIRAQYYFGAPVINAKVRYTVMRSSCRFPNPFLYRFGWLFNDFIPHERMELVCSGSGRTDDQGKFTVRIKNDNKKFKECDLRYQISAEVTDDSNRGIRASGRIVSSPVQFRVFARIRQGFAECGRPVSIEVCGMNPHGKKTEGKCKVCFYRHKLDKSGKSVRESFFSLKRFSFDLKQPVQRIVIEKPGIYEAECTVTDQSGHQEKCSVMIPVFGVGSESELFSELPLELTPDQQEYHPGDTAKVLISCAKPGNTVYLFIRSERQNTCQLITMKDTSKVVSFRIESGDMPNTFVQAMMVRDGHIESIAKQICVPPEKKIINVNAKTVECVGPRTKIPLELTLTGPDGKPVSGSVTVSVTDAALDGLADSNVPDIRTFFWGWKRWCHVLFSGWSRHYGMPYPAMASVRLMKAANALGAEADNADEGTFAKGGSSEKSSFVRTDFLDCAYFNAVHSVGKDGKLKLDIPLPDNLTTWKIRVWSINRDAHVGFGETSVLVKKKITARLELPVFLVEDDQVQLLANVHNLTQESIPVSVSIEADNNNVKFNSAEKKNVTVPAERHSVVEFGASAVHEGLSKIRLSADNKTEPDVLDLPLLILPKGFCQQITETRLLSSESGKAEIPLKLPQKYRRGTAEAIVNLTPGTAGMMCTLLPYLASGDSDNTFALSSRLVPILKARAAVENMGIPFDKLKFKGNPLFRDHWKTGNPPAFTGKVLAGNAEKALKKLLDMQNSDGGWGWFGGFRECSWPDTTAYVIDALLDLKDLKQYIDPKKIDRGLARLEKFAEEYEKKGYVSDTGAVIAFVLAHGGKRNASLEKKLYTGRFNLSPYGLAMLARALPEGPEKLLAIENLSQYLKINEKNDTACLEIPERYCFRWNGNENMTNAAYLELLLEQEPKQPTARRLANYLAINITNSPYRNTIRGLGYVVNALAKYIRKTNAASAEMRVSVELGGKTIGIFHVTRENLWTGDFSLILPEEEIAKAKGPLILKMPGRGEAYVTAMLRYYSLEDRIPPVGNEMRIHRNYYRLIPKQIAHPVPGKYGAIQTIRYPEYQRVALADGDSVKPGDLIEIELCVSAGNDYDYVVVKDRLPAGFSYEDPRSGWQWTGNAPYYMEKRQREARFYLRSMARGKSNFFYRLRAVLPGEFRARPASGEGVYAPQLKCNSGEFFLGIKQ